MIHFGETFYQLEVQVSLELQMIGTNQYFLQKEGVNQIVMRYKIGSHLKRKSHKQGLSQQNLPTMPMYGSTLPRMQLPSQDGLKLITFILQLLVSHLVIVSALPPCLNSLLTFPCSISIGHKHCTKFNLGLRY